MDVDKVVKAARAGEKISVDAMHVMGLLKAYVEAKEELKIEQQKVVDLEVNLANLKAGNAALLKDSERLDAIHRFLGTIGVDKIQFIDAGQSVLKPYVQRRNHIMLGGAADMMRGEGCGIREAVDAMMANPRVPT